MSQLLVIHHAPTSHVRRLTDAVLAGATDDLLEGAVTLRDLPALAFARDEAGPHDLIEADAYVLVTPANFGTMSGALKHVFDSTFLAIGGALADDGSGSERSGGATAGRPFGLVVHGRYDTAGATRAVLSITGALGWRQAADSLEIIGDVSDDHAAQAHELAGAVAAQTLL